MIVIPTDFKSQYSWEVTSFSDTCVYSLQSKFTAFWLLPVNLGRSLALAGSPFGAHHCRVIVLSINQVGGHVIVTISTNCILGSRATKHSHNGCLLGSARILQSLGLKLAVSERLHCVGATDLSNLGGSHLFGSWALCFVTVQGLACCELI